jgi:mycofactocin system glycosyltransferase
VSTELPVGFVVRLNRHVREYGGGRTLVGGSPTRVVRLADAARPMLRSGTLRVSDRATAALADRLLELGMADPVVAELASVDRADLTFVVPVRDRPRELDRLLASIGDGQRVIVVDDCSLEPTAVAEVVATHGAELLSLAVNVGPAGARNAGLGKVSTPFVAFVDSDVVLEPDALSVLLPHFHDPAVAMVAPQVLGLSRGADERWFQRYEAARSSLDLGSSPSTVRPRSPVAWVPSACIVARVAALDDGFDDSMRVGEDVDLVWRLTERGWRIRYEPAVRVHHEHRATVRGWLSRKAYYGTGADLLARRHGYDAAPAVLSPWFAGVALALLAQRRWSFPVAAGLSTAAAARISMKLRGGEHPIRLGARLTADGVLAALWQSSALLLRHWWPLAAAGAVGSRRARRAVLIAGLVDTASDYRRVSARLDPIRFTVARRLDDLAYGSGVWAGAIKGRSARALIPDLRMSRTGR